MSISLHFSDCRIKGDDFLPITDLSLDGVDAAVYAKICKAITEEKELAIEYCAKNGEVTKRRVRPEAVGYCGIMWYMVAFCQLRQEYRTFALMGIRSAKFTGKSAPAGEYVAQVKAERAQEEEALRRHREKMASYVPPVQYSGFLDAFCALLFGVIFKMKSPPQIGKNGKPLRTPARYKWHK